MNGEQTTGTAGAAYFLSYDLLRILAAFSVVVLHVSAQFWYDLPVKDSQWLIANSYNAAFRFGVPIFVMLSGALFLRPEYKLSVKRLYTHNVLRMAVLFLVWSAAYGIFDYFGFKLQEFRPDILWAEIKSGRYHLWFLPMIAAIYILLPVLKSWLNGADKKNVEYFLGVFMVYHIGKNTSLALFDREALEFLWGAVNLEIISGYFGYLVLGYYLTRYEVPRKIKRWLYPAAVLGTLCNIVFGNLLSLRAGAATGAIFDSYGAFTFLVVTALFVFFTQDLQNINVSPKTAGVMKGLSKDTLGIYLLHIGVLELLQTMGIHNSTIPSVAGIPLLSVVCFCLCALLAAALRRIPVLGRWIC